MLDLIDTPSASPFIEQDWSRYTAEDHAVWQLLYERRMADLAVNGSKVFLSGVEAIGLCARTVPNLTEVNARLAGRTGWSAVAVNGYMPARQFFECLAERRFPTTVIVRRRDQLDYLPEPDIFHDVFGHVPLHAHPVFADFLQTYGRSALLCEDEHHIKRLGRLFWFTVEFGLIREDGRIKAYGSGLMSSHGDCANALGPKVDRRPFDLDAVMAQPFEIDRFQDVLFVIDSYEQLFQAVEEVARRQASR